MEKDYLELRSKYNIDDLAFEEVVKRWNVIPDSRIKQKAIVEAKFGSAIAQLKKDLDRQEKQNRILEIE